MDLREFLEQQGLADIPHTIIGTEVIPAEDTPPDRKAAFLSAVANFDWAAAALSNVKRERIEANRREAQRRIAQALGMSPDTSFDKLVVKEANMLMHAVDAVASGDTATVANMRAIKAKIDAIRNAENTAAAAIEAATSKAAVDSVTVNWPV